MGKEKREVLNDLSLVLGGTKRLLSYWAGNHDYKLYFSKRVFVSFFFTNKKKRNSVIPHQ